MYPLFDDQKTIMANVRAALRRHKFVLLQSPTGSGKTAMGLEMIGGNLRQSGKSIFTFPRNTLLEQTSKTLSSFDIPHSFIAAGYPYNPFASVFLGMTETMARWAKNEKLPKDISLLVPDETHFGDAALDTIIKYYKRPWFDSTGRQRWTYGVGLSATPWKMNGQGLGIWYDEMVQGLQIRELINLKRLSDYRLFAGKKYAQMDAINRLSDDKAASAMESKAEIIGDAVGEYKQRGEGRLWVTRCTSIKHSNIMAQAYRDAGIPAMHVDGDTHIDEQRRIFKAYAKREIHQLTFVDLLNFGFDLEQITGIKVCIEGGSDLKPSDSLSGQMQFWGRLFRYKPFPAIINDHVNNHQKEHIGLPCRERIWTLDSETKKIRGGEFVQPTRQCPICWYAHPPAPYCPECRYEYEVEYREVKEVAGQLEEVDLAAERLEKRIAADGLSAFLPPANDERELDNLLKYAQKEGVKNPYSWAVSELEKKKRMFDNDGQGR